MSCCSYHFTVSSVFTLFAICKSVLGDVLVSLLWPFFQWISIRHSGFIRSSNRRCFFKKLLLNISQAAQENTCVGVSATLLLQHRCFPVKFAKFLRTNILEKSANDCFYFMPKSFNNLYWEIPLHSLSSLKKCFRSYQP